MTFHGRRARLILEYEKLLNLEKRSEFIEITPVDTIEGMPPENYVITFRCRGISGLEDNLIPKFAEFHQVSMKLSSNFPNQEPFLKWMTPIWHPNIDHNEPHHVCTNNVQNWFSTKSLDDLVVKLGEMVQYQHYHAEWMAPYPLDKEAADWVVNFAEPNGILGKNKPVDNRQLLRPQRIRPRGGRVPAQSASQEFPPPIPKPKGSGRLILGNKRNTGEQKNPFTSSGFIDNPYITKETKKNNNVKAPVTKNNKNSEPNRRKAITLGLRTKEVVCSRCHSPFKVPNTQGADALDFFCENCRQNPDHPTL